MSNTFLNDHMFAITKEQLHQINDEKVKEWFPNAFDNHLIKGAWYNVNGNLLCYNDGKPTYGFWNGDWGDNWKFPSNTECTIATNEQREKEFSKEIVKRGYIGNYIRLHNTGIISNDPVELRFGIANYVIIQNGKWAEIVPVMSVLEAQEKLNCKIID